MFHSTFQVSNKVGGRLGRGVTGVIQSGDRDMATFKPVANGHLKGPAELNRGDGGAGPGSVSGTGSSSVKNGSGRMEMTAIPDKDKSARDLQFQLSTTSTSASQVDNGQTIINGSIKVIDQDYSVHLKRDSPANEPFLLCRKMSVKKDRSGTPVERAATLLPAASLVGTTKPEETRNRSRARWVVFEFGAILC